MREKYKKMNAIIRIIYVQLIQQKDSLKIEELLDKRLKYGLRKKNIIEKVLIECQCIIQI